VPVVVPGYQPATRWNKPVTKRS